MTFLATLRRAVADQARALPLARRAHVAISRLRHEQAAVRFLKDGSGRADPLPTGILCDVDEVERREPLPLEALRRAFPAGRLEVTMTGGGTWVRKDVVDLLEVFGQKGYVCGCQTTDGTLVTEERADALAELARAGFLTHVSVSIDGPGERRDATPGVMATFAQASDGLRRLQAAARRKAVSLRVSVHATVAEETLDTLERVVEIAGELGVDTIEIDHLMFATAAERDETLRQIGETDPRIVATFVTDDPGVHPLWVRQKIERLRQACARRGVVFDTHPRVAEPLIDPYYTPGTPLAGRCLYPFTHAPVSSRGTVCFCPFIRVEVGDLTAATLPEIWNGPRYVGLRKRLLDEELFPVCRRCRHVELSSPPALPGTWPATVAVPAIAPPAEALAPAEP